MNPARSRCGRPFNSEKCLRQSDADLAAIERGHGPVSPDNLICRLRNVRIARLAGKREKARCHRLESSGRRHHIPVSLTDGEGRTHESRHAMPLEPMRTTGTPRPRFETLSHGRSPGSQCTAPVSLPSASAPVANIDRNSLLTVAGAASDFLTGTDFPLSFRTRRHERP